MAADFRPLFNGRNLDGWKMVGEGHFVVENGLMKTEGDMGLLYYEREKFGNCTIRVEFMTEQERGNSGVFIRIPEVRDDPWYAVNHGYEVQIDAGDNDWHVTGTLYSLTKAMAKPQNPPGEWNTMDIVLDGLRTTVILNGVTVTDFTPDQPVPERQQWYEPERGPRPESGYIGLQTHDPDSVVYFREVSVREN